jgi:hypothetical protein
MLGFAMNRLLISLRIVTACLLSGWVLLLWLGIDFWQSGIQQQIDGSRGIHHSPLRQRSSPLATVL